MCSSGGWGWFCDCSEAGCGHSSHIGPVLEPNSARGPAGAVRAPPQDGGSDRSDGGGEVRPEERSGAIPGQPRRVGVVDLRAGVVIERMVGARVPEDLHPDRRTAPFRLASIDLLVRI